MSEELKLVLDELSRIRKEAREDLGRVHDRIDKGLTETAASAAESAAFQASTNIKLTGIERRFDIQNGRLAKAEADMESFRRAMNIREGEAAMRHRLIVKLATALRVLREASPWIVATVATGMGAAALWRG